jgi:hypothetical protein
MTITANNSRQARSRDVRQERPSAEGRRRPAPCPPSPEPPGGQQREDQRHEEQHPQVRSQRAAVRATGKVDLVEQGSHEQREPDGCHEQAAVVVRASVPGDEPAGGERAADEAEHDIHGFEREVREEEGSSFRRRRSLAAVDGCRDSPQESRGPAF